jgi:hypothetical protein
MFLRIVRAAGGHSVKHEYVRVVEAYRERGKTRHRTILNLGRKDLLAAHLDLAKLTRLLHGEAAPERAVRREDVHAMAAWDWGAMLAARHLWCELGLEAVLDRLAGGRRGDGAALGDRALVLIANRLAAPSSEHGLARWLETDFVCDRDGRRFMPAWRDDAERQASRTPRVRVAARQLQQWYRSLDQLLAHKAAIEHALFLTLRDLFSLRVDMVFYDLTSTYFEGEGPPDLAAHGHSRDGKPRNRQVLVGLVMIDGWPIAHHVFAGNWRDAKTVPQVLRDLEQRFGLGRIVFVGDRGMVTSHNLDDLREHGHGYIVGRNRRRSGEVFDYIQSATGPWIECPAGITAREKASSPKTMVQEVTSNQPGVRVFVVHSDERLAYERAQRIKAMERVRARLEKLERRVAKGQIKAAEKIGAAAARILGRNHGHRYTTGAARTASSASSSTPSTSPASRPTKANTSSRPRSPVCPPLMPCASTRTSPMSSAPSPISRTSSICGRSITEPTRGWRPTSSSPPSPSCSIARSKRSSRPHASISPPPKL